MIRCCSQGMINSTVAEQRSVRIIIAVTTFTRCPIGARYVDGTCSGHTYRPGTWFAHVPTYRDVPTK